MSDRRADRDFVRTCKSVATRQSLPVEAPKNHLEGATLNLSQVGSGDEVRVRRLDCAPTTCQRLREMGFCENALVTKIRGGADLVCWVCGTRVALSARLAKQILVEHVDGRS